MNHITREEYIQKLLDRIEVGMETDNALRVDAILDGRIGLNEMSNSELVGLGRDCWGLPEELTIEGADTQPENVNAVKKALVIYGNPAEGFTYKGPFDSLIEAIEFANDELGSTEWWASELQPKEVSNHE